jgi:hypothetical protein
MGFLLAALEKNAFYALHTTIEAAARAAMRVKRPTPCSFRGCRCLALDGRVFICTG